MIGSPSDTMATGGDASDEYDCILTVETFDVRS
jgi:hypothetical protein